MKLTDSVERIVKSKGRHVHSIAPDVTVYEALLKMADQDIGALQNKIQSFWDTL